MNPDIAVGAGMVAVGVAAYAVNTIACRWARDRARNLAAVADDIDDLVLVARAAGVYIPADGGRSSGQMAAAIARYSAAPVSPLPVREREVDHDRCDGCQATICRCHEAERTSALIVLCGPDDVAQGCGHGHSLCASCAPGECDECLTDLRCQGVLSQYVTGTFTGTVPTGGAA